MFEHLAISSTSFLPRSGLEEAGALFTSDGASYKDYQVTSSATGTAESGVLCRVERSRTLDELQRDPLYGRLWQAAPELPAEPSPVEVARDHRLAILARKYEGATLSREDEARVAILTQRLRRLAPRVTKLSWTIAEEAVAELEAVSVSVDEIGAKYGL